MSEAVTPASILQLGTAFQASKTLLSAVSLGVFTELALGKQPAAELAERLGLHGRGARDFFDALVALGMLQRHDGVYGNTPETDLYLDNAKPTYIGGLLEMCDRRLYGHWERLTDALVTGRPQNEASGGGDHFAAIYADPARLEMFLRAMTGVSRALGRAIGEAFDWSARRSFVDAGCAQGGFPVEIARMQPHLTGIGFDLPLVGPIFDAFVRENGLSDRLRFQGGDVFHDKLPGADVVVMGHMLHGWDLAGKMRLLQAAHEALPAGGAVLIYDAMIDDERRHNVGGLMMSLNMLIETWGGYDYAGADCLGWMKDAGFRDCRVVTLPGNHGMAIGTK
jgi:SAM-dependent methyltransferase